MKKVQATEFKTKRIIENTGGIIKDYILPDYLGTKDERDFTLPNSFISKSEKYIGDYATAWWFFKNKMVVCEDYPHGVAKIVDSYKKDSTIGFYGFSHRGGCLFKIGDKLFDENYTPQEQDYTKTQWSTMNKDYEELIAKETIDHAGMSDAWVRGSFPLSSVFPFNLRGNKTIKNWDDAKQAAMNMSAYLG